MKKLKRRKAKKKYKIIDQNDRGIVVQCGDHKYDIQFDNNIIDVRTSSYFGGILQIQPVVSNSVRLVHLPFHFLTEMKMNKIIHKKNRKNEL